MELEIPDPYGPLLIAASFGVLLMTVVRARGVAWPLALVGLVVTTCGVMAAVFLAPLVLRGAAIFLTVLVIGRLLTSGTASRPTRSGPALSQRLYAVATDQSGLHS